MPNNGKPQKLSVIDAPVEPTPLPPEDVLSGAPQPSWAPIFEEEDGSFFAGVWHCTPGKFTALHPGNEIFCVTEGRATLTPVDGEPFEVNGGDTVFMPGGTRVLWEVHETVRKTVCAEPGAK